MADLDQAAGEVIADEAPIEVGGDDAFHSYTGDDGKTQSWKTPEELNGFIKQSGMFQSDYTRKTQSLADERRQFAEQQAAFKKSQEDWEKNEKAKYDKYNEVLSTRPQIQRMLADAVNKPAGPDEIYERSQSYADEKYSALEQKIASIEQEREEAKLEQARDQAFSELETEIPGFDRNTVMEALKTLDAGDPKSLMAMIYKSQKYNPVEMQQDAEARVKASAGAKMVSGGGGPAPKNKGSTDLNTAAEEAYADLIG